MVLAGDLSETGDAYVTAALTEIDLAGRVLGANAPPVSTVFVGGGTPTLLAAGGPGPAAGPDRDRVRADRRTPR